MQEAYFILLMWAIQAVIGAVPSLLIALFSRHRVHWYSWELIALFFPYCVWLALVIFWHTLSNAKGFSNFFVEPVFLGIAIILTTVVRFLARKGREADERLIAAILVGVLCLVAAGIFFFTPNLGGNFG